MSHYESRICPVCNTTYKADTQRLKFGRQTTCSKECSYELRAKKASQQVESTCGVCGKNFFRSPSHAKSKHGSVFCSPTCQYEARSLGITPRSIDKPYNWTQNGKEILRASAVKDHNKKGVTLTCSTCGKSFHKGLSTVMRYYPEVFCSRKCISNRVHKLISKKRWSTRRQNGNGNHSDATKKKLSEITSLQIATGVIKRVSNIEYLVAEKLANNNVDYIHQYPIRDSKTGRFVACCDFYLPTLHVIVEVNGTFWHADTRFYPNRSTLKPCQKRSLEKYEQKVALLKSLKIPLVEIWEHDIKVQPDTFLDSFLKDYNLY